MYAIRSYYAVDGTALDQAAFRVPLLVVHAEQGKVVADVVQNGIQAQFEDEAVAVVAQQLV